MWRGLVSDPILQTLNDMGDAKERWWRAELCTDAMFARRLGTLREVQRLRYEDTFGVDLQTPDFVSVAKAMGIRGHQVDTPDQFDGVFGQALTTPGPDLIEIDATNLAPIDLRPLDHAPSQ
jgi:thiamine pyrophosphate-dependent acetolactate synthase large subunit-like protein